MSSVSIDELLDADKGRSSIIILHLQKEVYRSASYNDHMMCLSGLWPTCQALLPLLSQDVGETASLHCRHQMMFPTQELLISHFQSRVVKHQVDTLNKRSKLAQCITVVNNVYRLQALKFTHSWHKGLLPSLFHDFFQYASEVHGYYTRYASGQNLYISCKVRTNSGKQTIAYTATILWDNIPTRLEDLNAFNFSKHLKLYLLSEQHSENK